jgi:hypothetical protein
MLRVGAPGGQVAKPGHNGGETPYRHHCYQAISLTSELARGVQTSATVAAPSHVQVPDAGAAAQGPELTKKGDYRYRRRRPERIVLYQVVQDNLETLYAAVEERFVSCFDIDIQCSNCGGPMQLKAFLVSPQTLRRLLRSLGEPTHAP